MSNNQILWLPNIDRLENYIVGENIDYPKLINNRINDLVNDFNNESDPVLFNGYPVYLDNKILSCEKLKNKNCYNETFYNCENCPFEGKLDIINHIFTIEYTNKKLKNLNGKISLKQKYKKSGKKSIPRTPGEFCIPRVLLSSWIKPIIKNSNDELNVKITEPKPKDSTYTLELINKKYKLHLKEFVSKRGNKYYILKTAYYYTEPKELIDFENMKYINNAFNNRRNATDGVSTTHCIDL